MQEKIQVDIAMIFKKVLFPGAKFKRINRKSDNGFEILEKLLFLCGLCLDYVAWKRHKSASTRG